MKKATCTILATVLGLSTVLSMAGCGKDPVANDENTIEYSLIEGGYGLEWFDRVTEKFKEKHPEVNFVKSKKTTNWGEAKTVLSAGPDVTTCDLFMGSEDVMEYALYGDSLLAGYDCVLEDLSDIYNSNAEGDSVKIKDKMVDGFEYAYSLKDEETGTTKYYAFPWIAGVTGIVYNATQFEQMGLRVPRTTDELFDVTCQTIKDEGKVPFVASKEDNYDYFVWEIWNNQYYGFEGMELRYQCKIYDEDSGKYVYSEEAWKDIGVLHTAVVKEKMIGVRYGNMHENVNTMTYTQAQAQMLLGNAMMYVCGDWLENEMKKQTGNGDTLKYMKTPIISEIIEHTPSIPNDEVLKEVVSYIDGEITERPAGVSDDDLAYIQAARKVQGLSTFQSAYIPSYASAKGMAKEFLKYLASDEAIKICFDSTGGSFAPFEYDIRADETRWNSLSPFMKTKYDLLEGAQTIADKSKFRLQVFGALKTNSTGISSDYTAYASKNPADRNTAEEYYQDRLTYFTREMLDSALRRAGLI